MATGWICCFSHVMTPSLSKHCPATVIFLNPAFFSLLLFLLLLLLIVIVIISASKSGIGPYGLVQHLGQWTPASAVSLQWRWAAAAAAASTTSSQSDVADFPPTSNPNNCRCPHQRIGALSFSLSDRFAEGGSCWLFLEFLVAIFSLGIFRLCCEQAFLDGRFFIYLRWGFLVTLSIISGYRWTFSALNGRHLLNLREWRGEAHFTSAARR